MARQRRDREELHRLRKRVTELETLLAGGSTSAPESRTETTATGPRHDTPALPDGFSLEDDGATTAASRPTGTAPRRTTRTPKR